MGVVAVGMATKLPAAENPLVAERWQSRPLIAVVPAQDSALLRRLQAQLRVPEMQEGFREREMVLFVIVAGQGQRQGQAMTEAQTRSLMAALGIAADGRSEVLLVGKDGGIKLREAGEELSLEAIFTLIDGMPMRRR